MDSRSETVRAMYRKFCSRGYRTTVIFSQPYKGGPTPLWKNIGVERFKQLQLVSIFLLLSCAFEFIYLEVALRSVEKEKKANGIINDWNCYEFANVSFIVNILSMIINVVYYQYLSGVEYATDERWSQYMAGLAFNIGGQFIGATVAGTLMVSDQIKNFAECAELMQGLYIRQYLYTILNYIIILVQITSLLNMAMEFFKNTESHFYYKRETEI